MTIVMIYVIRGLWGGGKTCSNGDEVDKDSPPPPPEVIFMAPLCERAIEHHVRLGRNVYKQMTEKLVKM